MRKGKVPPERGLSCMISRLRSVADPPAPIGVADAMRAAPTAGSARRHDDRAWSYDDRGAAVVGAAIIAIRTTCSARATMPAGPAAAGDRDRYASLIERRQGHGLACCDAENADADNQCEREKPVHSCLLWFFAFLFAPLGAF